MAAIDIPGMVPNSVTVSFPEQLPNGPSTETYAITVDLNTLNLPPFMGLIGFNGTRIFRDTCVANFSTNLSVPDNQEELEDLAEQIATDYYMSQLAAVDLSFSEIVTWTPTALDDTIEWDLSGTTGLTRVIRDTWNDNMEDLYHYGSFGSSTWTSKNPPPPGSSGGGGGGTGGGGGGGNTICCPPPPIISKNPCCIPDICPGPLSNSTPCPAGSLPCNYTLDVSGLSGTCCGKLNSPSGGPWVLYYITGKCTWATTQQLDFSSCGGNKGPAWSIQVVGPNWQIYAAGSLVATVPVGVCGQPIIVPISGWPFNQVNQTTGNLNAKGCSDCTKAPAILSTTITEFQGQYAPLNGTYTLSQVGNAQGCVYTNGGLVFTGQFNFSAGVGGETGASVLWSVPDNSLILYYVGDPVRQNSICCTPITLPFQADGSVGNFSLIPPSMTFFPSGGQCVTGGGGSGSGGGGCNITSPIILTFLPTSPCPYTPPPPPLPPPPGITCPQLCDQCKYTYYQFNVADLSAFDSFTNPLLLTWAGEQPGDCVWSDGTSQVYLVNTNGEWILTVTVPAACGGLVGENCRAFTSGPPLTWSFPASLGFTGDLDYLNTGFTLTTTDGCNWIYEDSQALIQLAFLGTTNATLSIVLDDGTNFYAPCTTSLPYTGAAALTFSPTLWAPEDTSTAPGSVTLTPTSSTCTTQLTFTLSDASCCDLPWTLDNVATAGSPSSVTLSAVTGVNCDNCPPNTGGTPITTTCCPLNPLLTDLHCHFQQTGNPVQTISGLPCHCADDFDIVLSYGQPADPGGWSAQGQPFGTCSEVPYGPDLIDVFFDCDSPGTGPNNYTLIVVIYNPGNPNCNTINTQSDPVTASCPSSTFIWTGYGFSFGGIDCFCNVDSPIIGGTTYTAQWTITISP